MDEQIGTLDTFYRDFEARFRGSREVILGRLTEAYASFVRPIAHEGGEARALDLGCGRGEWLSLLGRWGFTARGVDLDDAMLDEARREGLDVSRADALEFLNAVPDSSLALVSAFHLIEHLAFDDLRELVRQARRVLRPGGLLVLETPNPENPVVGLVNFHLDATHVRPIPPQLLSFLVEWTGFERHALLRLQGAPPRPDTAATLSALLVEVSLDFAIVARAEGPEPPALKTAAAEAFDREVGLGLHAGVARFDAARAEAAAGIARRLDALGAGQTDVVRLRDAMKVVQADVGGLRDEVDWRAMSWPERLLFRRSGRPVRPLRRLLFHASGKPRGVFRAYVLSADGIPRRPFRRWMQSEDYRRLPWPSQMLSPSSTPVHTIAAADHPLRAKLIADLEGRASKLSIRKGR